MEWRVNASGTHVNANAGVRGWKCPGPRRSWHANLLPWNWLLRPVCAYDLSGSAGAGFPIRCPECGRLVERAGELRRRCGRVRWWTMPIIAGVLWASFEHRSFITAGEWCRHAPSGLLVAIERNMGTGSPWGVRREVRKRLDGAALTPGQRASLRSRLVRDLRADHHRFNSLRAMEMLRMMGAEAEPDLRAALHSDDHQQRQFAASLLRRFPGPPGPLLIRVSVEGLVDDGIADWNAELANFGGSVRWLIEHAEDARPFLLESLGSDDAQARLGAAMALSFGGVTGEAEAVVEAMLPHIEDNDIAGDALIAVASMFRLGEEAIPALERASASDTMERRRLVCRLLIDDIRMGDARSRAIDRRWRSLRITRLGDNPCRDIEIWQYLSPR